MISKVLFSNEKNDWETPQDLFDVLNKEFSFTLDACANENNAKCKKYFSIKENGLIKSWKNEIVFVNPPYSKISDWLKKCFFESLRGVIVVCLIPCRTDTKYFHNYIFNKCEIRFIKGRLSFSGSKNSAPFSSVILVYDKNIKNKNVYKTLRKESNKWQCN